MLPLLRRSMSPLPKVQTREEAVCHNSLTRRSGQDSLLSPMMPHVWMLKTRCVRPFLLSIAVISPLRCMTISMIRLPVSVGEVDRELFDRLTLVRRRFL